jgi:hypothetical protein
MTQIFTLYSSDGCHLCEEALAMCLAQMPAINIEVIDIVDAEIPELIDLYGVHIPVLEKVSDKTKLFWPFNAEQITELL